MTFWIPAILLLVIVTAALALPARKGFSRQVAGAKAASLAVYRDQLAGIDLEVERGLLSGAEAEGQRAEIGRRMLATAREAADAETRATPVPLALALIVPLVALGAYVTIGNPDLPDVPRAQRLANAQKTGDIDALVVQVESHLANSPDDANGWQLLVPNYMNMGRYNDAATALTRVITLSGPSAERFAGLSEALTLGNGGMMTPAAVSAAEEAMKLDPKDPRARYYAALGLSQNGKKQEAIAAFSGLLAESPADAPWRPTVEREIAKLKGDGTAPQISDEQMQNAANMTPEERMTMIRGMVEGLEQKLAANGADAEGWLRLLRARATLNEPEKASAALASARAALKNDQPGLAAIEALAKELSLK